MTSEYIQIVNRDVDIKMAIIGLIIIFIALILMMIYCLLCKRRM